MTNQSPLIPFFQNGVSLVKHLLIFTVLNSFYTEKSYQSLWKSEMEESVTEATPGRGRKRWKTGAGEMEGEQGENW